MASTSCKDNRTHHHGHSHNQQDRRRWRQQRHDQQQHPTKCSRREQPLKTPRYECQLCSGLGQVHDGKLHSEPRSAMPSQKHTQPRKTTNTTRLHKICPGCNGAQPCTCRTGGWRRTCCGPYALRPSSLRLHLPERCRNPVKPMRAHISFQGPAHSKQEKSRDVAKPSAGVQQGAFMDRETA